MKKISNKIASALGITLGVGSLISQQHLLAQSPVDATGGVHFGNGANDPKAKKGTGNTDLQVEVADGSALTVYSGLNTNATFAAGEGHEASVTAGNWYRIAQSSASGQSSGYKRSNAVFTLRDDISSGGHSTVVFRAGMSYGAFNRMGVTLLSHTSFSQTTFTEVRILHDGVYDAYYLEVKVNRSGNVRYSIRDNLGNGAWVPVDWTLTSSIPNGYTERKYNIDKLFMVGDYKNRFSISRGGSMDIDGTLNISGSPVLTQSSATGLYVPLSSNNAGSVNSFLMEGTYDSNLNVPGSHLGDNLIPVQGAGTRLMWFPEKAAFRVGNVSDNSWNNTQIGAASVAMGYDTQATQFASSAFGYDTLAARPYTTAMGYKTTAGDWYATAMGHSSIANGWISTAMGENCTASGRASFAIGYKSISSGMRTIAMGSEAKAIGAHSLSMGSLTESYGIYSVAMGVYTDAYGAASTAIGSYTDAKSYASLALGQYNEGRGTAAGETVWQGDDQHSVLEVGVGTSASPKNALTVLQDGSVEVGKATDGSIPLQVKADGSVIINKAQGDISMGAFGN